MHNKLNKVNAFQRNSVQLESVFITVRNIFHHVCDSLLF